ncbi:MAG: thermonuclease family protein [Burkholderiaceae bacterium]
MLGRAFAWVTFIATVSCPPASGAELDGTIVRVADGDTVTLLDAGKTQHRIRLDGIDAPERTQPYGQRARQSLVALAHGRAARAECPKVDRYGREVCRVVVDGVDVGLEQIRRGFAWHYLKYAHEQRADDRSSYARAETQARAAHSGLWSFSDPTPPWEYRRLQKAELR